MDPIRPNVSSTAGARPLGPMARHRGLVLFALATTTAIVVGVRYKSNSLQRNEKAQKGSYHVTVDRSGGGV